MVNRKRPLRIHITNVVGVGATQLCNSLLPSIEQSSGYFVEQIYLPDRGELSTYQPMSTCTKVHVYKRLLPNSISRIFECLIFANRFNGNSPLLVLGDLPLRCSTHQTLFIQQSNLFRSNLSLIIAGEFKYLISKLIFGINLRKISSFIVQTQVMKNDLIREFPTAIHKPIFVISQPVPSWLLTSGIKRKMALHNLAKGLRLIYPAANYPHKNHAILSELVMDAEWPIEYLSLTLNVDLNPAPHVSWLRCVGFLSPQDMRQAYSEVDALLFLSKEESYGFPLLEAIHVGLPIVCPDLPYARNLCGDQAIYFDPNDPASLLIALKQLIIKLKAGWWPDWTSQRASIPKNWVGVAGKVLEVTTSK